MAAILTNGVLKIRTAPIFHPLLAGLAVWRCVASALRKAEQPAT